jgi:hypothetical protein
MEREVDQVGEAPEYRPPQTTMDHRVDERPAFQTIPKLIKGVEELSSETRST